MMVIRRLRGRMVRRHVPVHLAQVGKFATSHGRYSCACEAYCAGWNDCYEEQCDPVDHLGNGGTDAEGRSWLSAKLDDPEFRREFDKEMGLARQAGELPPTPTDVEPADSIGETVRKVALRAADDLDAVANKYSMLRSVEASESTRWAREVADTIRDAAIADGGT